MTDKQWIDRWRYHAKAISQEMQPNLQAADTEVSPEKKIPPALKLQYPKTSKHQGKK